MRLIGVAGARGEICEALLRASLSRDLEKTLKTQHGLKHLWTIPDGGRKSPVKLTFTDSDPPAQLRDTALRMLREPPDAGNDSLVRRGEVFDRGGDSSGQS
jgi:hypothetical protein